MLLRSVRIALGCRNESEGSLPEEVGSAKIANPTCALEAILLTADFLGETIQEVLQPDGISLQNMLSLLQPKSFTRRPRTESCLPLLPHFSTLELQHGYTGHAPSAAFYFASSSASSCVVER